MTAQEVGHLGIEIKAQEDPTRVAEYQNKGHQLVLSTTNGDVTEVTPVDLGLFARQRLQALKGLWLWSGAIAGHLVAKMIRTTTIASLPHHRIETTGGERGVLLQCLHDEREIGVNHDGTISPLHLG